MIGMLGGLAAVALLVWMVGGRRRPAPAPEDAGTSEIDLAVLEQAERELGTDPEAETFDAEEDADDWGPGAP